MKMSYEPTQAEVEALYAEAQVAAVPYLMRKYKQESSEWAEQVLRIGVWRALAKCGPEAPVGAALNMARSAAREEYRMFLRPARSGQAPTTWVYGWDFGTWDQQAYPPPKLWAYEARKALEALGPEDRAVVERYYFQDKDSVEQAAEAGVTPQAIRYRLNQALGKMRKALEGAMPRRTGKEGLHPRVREGEVLRQKHERARRKAQEQKEVKSGEVLP